MTPREFYREQEAATQRWHAEAEQRAAQAWMTAALARAEKFPKLEDVLPRRWVRKQTPDEQRAVLYQLSKRYNIPLRES